MARSLYDSLASCKTAGDARKVLRIKGFYQTLSPDMDAECTRSVHEKDGMVVVVVGGDCCAAHYWELAGLAPAGAGFVKPDFVFLSADAELEIPEDLDQLVADVTGEDDDDPALLEEVYSDPDMASAADLDRCRKLELREKFRDEAVCCKDGFAVAVFSGVEALYPADEIALHEYLSLLYADADPELLEKIYAADGTLKDPSDCEISDEEVAQNPAFRIPLELELHKQYLISLSGQGSEFFMNHALLDLSFWRRGADGKFVSLLSLTADDFCSEAVETSDEDY